MWHLVKLKIYGTGTWIEHITVLLEAILGSYWCKTT